MYESFGAAVSDDEVEFRLFLPDNRVDARQYERGGSPRIASVKVAGDFQARPWDLDSAPRLEPTQHPSGTLYVRTVPGLQERFYEYKYYVTFENQTSRWCTDPCTKYVGRSNQNAGFVVGGTRIERVAPSSKPRALADLVIYELMIDDFTAGYRESRAPVDAVLDKLDGLLELGVNTIEFMPWTAWRGEAFSWGYNPFLFFSVENRYIEDPSVPADRLVRLQRLVDALHRRGVGVIMDGVFNHVDAGQTPDTGFPYFWLYQDPTDSPYVGSYSGGGYFEEIDFDNACAQEFITDVCKFWLDRYQLDGIRFDYVRGYFEPDDREHGITRLVRDLHEHLAAQSRDHVALILEDLPDNRYQAIDDTNRIGADACWYDRLHFDIPEAAERNAVSPELIRVLNSGLDFAPAKLPVIYVENHDHSSVVNRVGGRDRWYRTQAPAIALFTSPGAVMLHNGQEIGIDIWMPEQGDGRVMARPIDWAQAGDSVGRALFDLYARLADIRAGHASLRTTNFYPWPYDAQAGHLDGYGVDVDRRVVIFHRWGVLDGGAVERVIVALNFSPVDQTVDVPFSVPGRWAELLDGADVDVRGFVARGVRLPSNWGRVYVHSSPA
jgi:1,4-alpha-glucan branching enzyme